MQKYQAVAMDIRQKITSGEYARGCRLPTTAEMCEAYGVSRITIKRAMDDLVSEGIISRRRGSGTYVKGVIGSLESLAMGNASSSQGNLRYGYDVPEGTPSQEVHEFSVIRPPEDIALILGLEADELVYSFCRTLLIDGKPMMVEHAYVPLRIVPNLRESVVRDSLLRYITNQLGLTEASVHRAIGAACPTAEEASWLGIDESCALVSVRLVRFLDDGTPFMASRCVHAPGYEFHDVSASNSRGHDALGTGHGRI